MNFIVRYPEGWSVAPKRYANLDELINEPIGQQGVKASARIRIGIVTRENHAQAVSELRESAAEVSSPSTFLNIGGWPAFQRRHLERRPQPNRGPEFVDKMVLRITTAVAVENRLVHLAAELPSDADQQLIDQVEAIGQGLVFTTRGDPNQVQQELENLRSSTPLKSSTPLPQKGSSSANFAPSSTRSASAVSASITSADESAITSLPGSSQQVMSLGLGELEVAASTNGQNIVIAGQNCYSISNDGGRTFPPMFSNCIPTTSGDPSVAFGRSGTFYFASINKFNDSSNNPFAATAIFVSTNNNGQNQPFTFRTNAVVCPEFGSNRCFPDQEHIAADRVNAAPGGDQVYSVWRNFDSTSEVASIVCSKDSGANWTAPLAIDTSISADFPRITVGQDGFVYVVYTNQQSRLDQIRLQKYSSCQNGLAPVTTPTKFPRTVAALREVACPVPGLDRCSGTNLSSPMVAVDDTNANHIYVAYALSTRGSINGICNDQNTCNEDIIVQDSPDGGITWNDSFANDNRTTVDSGRTARRFMPWICAVGGVAHVSWYDREAANAPNAASNDLTNYFRGTAFVDTIGGTPRLAGGRAFQVNEAGSADAQCAAGQTPGSAASWPGGVTNTDDSESCFVSAQPTLAQLAGSCTNSGMCQMSTCSNNPSVMCAMDSDCANIPTGVRCDFSDCGGSGMNTGAACQCATGSVCNTARGLPKYGDYNGNACAAGRLYMAWASATPPPGVMASGGIDIFFAVEPPIVLGDIDSDGDVDRDDLRILLRDEGKSVSESACGFRCDLNGDGQISNIDAHMLIQLCSRPQCATQFDP
jgi:hypothetical protein